MGFAINGIVLINYGLVSVSQYIALVVMSKCENGEKPMYEVRNHFLFKDGVQVKHVPSPNHGGEISVRIVVIHFTGTPGLSSPLSWLCNRGSGVSAHLLIDLDGTVYQLLPLNVKGWHAGVSSWNGLAGVNGFSIGIENVGVGGPWPDAQVEAIRDVLSAISKVYDIQDIVGHEDVAPGRKFDPGKKFPWDRVTV